MRIQVIKEVLKSDLFTCKYCNIVYLPMSDISASFCVICQKDEIKEYEENLVFLENHELNYDDTFFGVTD